MLVCSKQCDNDISIIIMTGNSLPINIAHLEKDALKLRAHVHEMLSYIFDRIRHINTYTGRVHGQFWGIFVRMFLRTDETSHLIKSRSSGRSSISEVLCSFD